MKLIIAIILIVSVNGNDSEKSVSNSIIHSHPCNESDNISTTYEIGKSEENANEYNVHIKKSFKNLSKVIIKVNAEAKVTLNSKEYGKIHGLENNTFEIQLFQKLEEIDFSVKGLTLGVIPYIISLNINTKEYCYNPSVGYLDKYKTEHNINNNNNQAEITEVKEEKVCGKRKVKPINLTNNGTFTKSEDWPWHVLIHMNNTGYYFDGTLISKNLVLTIASYVSDRQKIYEPDYFRVAFNPEGEKYEEVDVETVIVHEDFQSGYKVHDIALLKLKNDVVFNSYIHPVCVGASEANQDTILDSKQGTVVGYKSDGDETYIHLNTPLRQNVMTIVPRDICKTSKPDFYAKFFTDDKFCAENQKGIKLCMGDTAAPYHVFIPDNDKPEINDSGVWYVRGLLQRSPIKGPPWQCDPEQYFIFTDVEKHLDWIKIQMKEHQ